MIIRAENQHLHKKLIIQTPLYNMLNQLKPSIAKQQVVY
ncbi:hypothetical protein N037_09760 [Enterobacter sp. EGD-HP1]|nr:hypothetical protein N037_09760 [Enterobacter sp. EGD-HP1]